MPDDGAHPFPSPTAQRGQPERRSGVRAETSRGLPIVSAEPLTAKEREALRDLARALRVTADRIDESIDKNRVDLGLEACAIAGELGNAAATAAAVIGSGR